MGVWQYARLGWKAMATCEILSEEIPVQEARAAPPADQSSSILEKARSAYRVKRFFQANS
jgi:hypothetical protein